MRFVDSHLHLGDGDRFQALALASRGDFLLMTCGVDHETSLACLALARSSPSARAFVGLHPSEAVAKPDLGWLPEALRGAAGLGEVGLDPKYSPAGPGSAQAKAFHSQLGEAARLGRPVQVHSRDAEGACIDEVGVSGVKSVLFHWFQDEGRLRQVQDKGYYVSFGPSTLYSKKLQRMAASADRTLILTETDNPVEYAPLGGAGGPSLIPSVVFKLAELWRVTFEEARQTIAQNAARYLGLSEKG